MLRVPKRDGGAYSPSASQRLRMVLEDSSV